MQTSDLSLLERIISQRDEAAFGELYSRYSTLLLAYLGSRIQPSEASEDILHDIFMEIWDSAAEVQQRCGDDLKKWLFARAKSLMANHLKKAYRLVGIEDISMKDELELSISNVLEDIDLEDLVKVIDEVVKEMPFHLQQIYQLRVRHRYSVEETARALSISEKTVYTKTSEMMNELRFKLNLRFSTSANSIAPIAYIIVKLLLGEQ